jgi:hypothetical protein
MKRGWRCPFIARKGKGEGHGGGGVGARRPAINGGSGRLGASVTGGEEAVWECGGALMASGGDGRARGAGEAAPGCGSQRRRGGRRGAAAARGRGRG